MHDTVELARRTRAHLRGIDGNRAPLTYQALARSLGLRPPNTIHRVALALEQCMEEDDASRRPFIAALVISKRRDGLPAPGFFECARRLGRFQGDSSGPEARAFHQSELAAAIEFWLDS